MKRHFTLPILASNLDRFLDEIDELAGDQYEIVCVIPSERGVLNVTVKFTVEDDDVEFNEEVIRRLGF